MQRNKKLILIIVAGALCCAGISCSSKNAPGNSPEFSLIPASEPAYEISYEPETPSTPTLLPTLETSDEPTFNSPEQSLTAVPAMPPSPDLITNMPVINQEPAWVDEELHNAVKKYILETNDSSLTDITSISFGGDSFVWFNGQDDTLYYAAATPIKSCADFDKFPSLTYLSFSHSSIDISYLPNMPKLTTLSLFRHGVDKIPDLSRLTALQVFSCRECLIDDLSPLSGMKQLLTIDVEGNFITSLEPISDLTQLTDLRISYNNISSLAPISEFHELFRLYAAATGITDLTPLANLENLNELWIDSEKITDWAPVSHVQYINY